MSTVDHDRQADANTDAVERFFSILLPDEPEVAEVGHHDDKNEPVQEAPRMRARGGRETA